MLFTGCAHVLHKGCFSVYLLLTPWGGLWWGLLCTMWRLNSMLYSMYDIACFFIHPCCWADLFVLWASLLFLANEILTLFCILYVHQNKQIMSSTHHSRVSGSENCLTVRNHWKNGFINPSRENWSPAWAMAQPLVPCNFKTQVQSNRKLLLKKPTYHLEWNSRQTISSFLS